MSDLAFKIKQTLPPRDTTFTQGETRQECLTFRTCFLPQSYDITQKEMYQECPDFWKAIDAGNYKEAVAIAEQRGLAF
jgi:NADPH-dependent glutamate synthase beta subunit-like oxidoreductase